MMRQFFIIFFLFIAANSYSQSITFNEILKLKSMTYIQYDAFFKNKGFGRNEFIEPFQHPNSLDLGYSKGSGLESFLIHKDAIQKSFTYNTGEVSKYDEIKKSLITYGFTFLKSKLVNNQLWSEIYIKEDIEIQLYILFTDGIRHGEFTINLTQLN